MSNGAFDLGSYGAEIVLSTNTFDQGMSNAENQMNKVDKKAKGFGANLGKLAVGAVAGLGTALAGTAVVGVKMADDLDRALNGLQAATGTTDDEMKGMEESLKRIYQNNFGESFEDIAQSMALVKQNTGLSGQALEDLTTQALMLRDTFELDIEGSTRAADTMMKQFGITSEQAMTLIAQGAQKGANKNGDLLDVLNEYSPQFASIGLSAEESMNLLMNSAENGAFSVDKIGDAVKEMNIKMKDGNPDTIAALKSMGLNADSVTKSFAQGGEKGKKAFQDVMKALSEVEDPLVKNQLGVSIMGTMYEDLEAGAVDAMANINGSANMTGDTLSKINDVKYDSFGEAVSGIGRNLQMGLIEPMQKYVLPLLSDFANWITANMPQIQATMSTVFEYIGGIIGGFVNVIKGVISAFKDTETSTNSSFTNIKDTISLILTTIRDIINDITSAIKVIWQKYGDDIMAFAKTTWENISTVIKGVLSVIRGVVKTVLSLLTGDWKGAWEGIKMIVSGVWNTISGLVSQYINGVRATVSVVLTAIKNVFSSIWEGIKSVVSNAVSNIFSSVQNKFNSLKNTISSIFNGIYSVASNMFNRIKSAITNPVETARSTIVGIVNKIKDAFNFTWKLPKLKMPRVSVTMKENGWGIPYPDFDVSWWARGGIADKTMLYGVGEAGKEAIIPLDNPTYMAPFADAVYDRIESKLLSKSPSNTVTNKQDIILHNNVTFNVTKKLDQSEMDQAVKYMFKSIGNTFSMRGVTNRV